MPLLPIVLAAAVAGDVRDPAVTVVRLGEACVGHVCVAGSGARTRLSLPWVADAGPGHVLVAWQRLVVRVRRSDLRDALVHPEERHEGGRREPIGVTVAAGLPVRAGDLAVGRTRVRDRGLCFHLDVAADEVGAIHERSEAGGPRRDVDVDAIVAPGTPMWTFPAAGRRVGALGCGAPGSPAAPIGVATEGFERGRVQVRAVGDFSEVGAWVDRGAVTPWEPPDLAALQPTLPVNPIGPGGLLFDAPDGRPVGWAASVLAAGAADARGWMSVDVDTPWGVVRLAAPPGAQATEREKLPSADVDHVQVRTADGGCEVRSWRTLGPRSVELGSGADAWRVEVLPDGQALVERGGVARRRFLAASADRWSLQPLWPYGVQPGTHASEVWSFGGPACPEVAPAAARVPVPPTWTLELLGAAPCDEPPGVTLALVDSAGTDWPRDTVRIPAHTLRVVAADGRVLDGGRLGWTEDEEDTSARIAVPGLGALAGPVRLEVALTVESDTRAWNPEQPVRAVVQQVFEADVDVTLPSCPRLVGGDVVPRSERGR